MQLEIITDYKQKKVVKSNALIEAKYVFSLMEMRTFAYLVTLIQKGDKPNKRYSFEIKNLERLLYDEDKRSGKIYAEVKSIMQTLRNKSFWLVEDKKEKLVSYIKDPQINRNSGTVSFEFYPELRPHIFDLKARFTQYSLIYVAKMKSKYSARIYETLKQYESIGYRQFKIDEFREYVGLRVYDNKKKIIKDAMKRYPDLRRNVLEVAVKEISEKTDIIVSYEPIKNKNKVVKIAFSIEKKSQGSTLKLPSNDLFNNTNADLSKIEMVFIQKFGMKVGDAQSLYKNALDFLSAKSKEEFAKLGCGKDEYLWEKIKYCELFSKKNNVENIIGLLHTAIKENYKTEGFERKIKAEKVKSSKKQLERHIQTLEDKYNALEKEHSNEMLKLLEDWIPQHQEESESILEVIKKRNSYINRSLKRDRSLLDNVKASSMIKIFFVSAFYEMHGDEEAVSAIKNRYVSHLEQLQLEIKQQKEKLENISLSFNSRGGSI